MRFKQIQMYCLTQLNIDLNIVVEPIMNVNIVLLTCNNSQFDYLKMLICYIACLA